MYTILYYRILNIAQLYYKLLLINFETFHIWVYINTQKGWKGLIIYLALGQ